MDKNDIRLTFPAMFSETLRKFGKSNAYAFVGEEPRTYETVNKEIKSLISFLEKNGIGTLIHYPVPVHLQPAYKGRLRCAGSMANTEQATQEIISLPVCPELSPAHVNRIAEIITDWSQGFQK